MVRRRQPRSLLPALLSALLTAACSGPAGPRVRAAADAGPTPAAARSTSAARPDSVPAPVSPGDERGPGRFVARGDARSFYAAGGGQLWFYLNSDYWVRKDLDPTDLWIKTDVVARFVELRRWRDGAAVESRPPKFTHEYWKVGPSGRTVKLDNHKDFVLLSDGYAAGALVVEVALALGRLRERGPDGVLRPPRAPYVLEARDYGTDRGVGPDALHFEPLPGEPVTRWAYRVPWSSLPGPMTRSVWEGLRPPKWQRLEVGPPPHAGPRVPHAPTAPATTPGDRPLAPSATGDDE